MAKITRKKSTPKRRPAVKKAAPKKSGSTLKPTQANKPKMGDDPSKTKDRPLGSDDAKEARKGKETDQAPKVKETGPSKETGESKESDTEDKFEESDELKNEKGQGEELSEELQGLKDALASLYDKLGEEEEDKPEAPQNLGGCSGSKKSQATDSEGGQKDWNSVLAAGIAAVKAQQLGGQGQPGQGQQLGLNSRPRDGSKANRGVKGMQGQRGPQGAKGRGGNPLQRLRADYDKAKSSGAELQPEIENQARQLLGLPPLEGAGQDGPQRMASGF